MAAIDSFLKVTGVFFVLYLIGYATFLFASVVAGAIRLYSHNRMLMLKSELKHEYYVPVSIIVPAHNEEVTVVAMVQSLLDLKYRLYEIVVVDDGSTDETAAKLIDSFSLHQVDRPIHRMLRTKPIKSIYESRVEKIKITLICKENGGKGDALNAGINASEFPYFLCVDADSMLQYDSLEKIVQPVMESESVVAVGGLIRIAQCVTLDKGHVVGYHLPWNPIVCMQVMEYDRSFLASRILLDMFNGNLIISGAFGLFKKSAVIAAGGYDSDTMGEDMELIVKLHVFCRNSSLPYRIRYEPNAICWSQGPTNLKDLSKQRRRWHLGLFQSMKKYSQVFGRLRFGSVGFISYLYYLLYELLSPTIEMFGLLTVLLAWSTGLINIRYMISFYLIYAVYGAVLTLTAFFQRIYTQNLKISFLDTFKAVMMCLLESVFFRFVLEAVRAGAFLGYKKKKHEWGTIKREAMKTASSNGQDDGKIA